MSEQPASLIAISECHAPEPAAIHARDPVVASQPFVDERVVRVEELCDAAILAKRAPKQQFGFTLERLQQALVVGRISIGIDDDLRQSAQVQPLSGESIDEGCPGPRIGQHPPHLSIED